MKQNGDNLNSFMGCLGFWMVVAAGLVWGATALMVWLANRLGER